jgi:hypothetical protein
VYICVGKLCSSFQEAAREGGYLADDIEWDRCLDKARLIQSGRQLRHLFVTICINCSPSDPLAFLQKFYNDLSEDLAYQLGVASSDHQAHMAALLDIEMTLEQQGATLDTYHLPTISDSDRFLVVSLLHSKSSNSSHCGSIRHIDPLTTYDMKEETTRYTTMLSRLYDDQLKVHDAIKYALESDSNQPRLFFVDGPAGHGKTTLFETLLAMERSKGHGPIPVATSGIAATLLTGGRTAHSRFKLPINNCTAESMCSFSKRDDAGKLLIRTRLLIWDEGPMAHKWLYDALDRSLRDVRECKSPFGRVVVVIGGDFRQTLPIVPKGGRAQTVDACITESPLWSKFTRMCLTKNMHPSEGIDIANFSQMLINIGDGQYPITKPPSTITIPPCLQSSEIASTNMKDFIDEIYPDLEANYRNKDYLLGSSILVPLNRNVDDMNNAIIDVLHLSANDITTYQSIDTVEETDSHLYPVEFLNSINIPDIPPHTIQLGVGMIIMLLRNLDLHNGDCNGSRYIITKLCPHIIEAQTIDGPSIKNYLSPVLL